MLVFWLFLIYFLRVVTFKIFREQSIYLLCLKTSIKINDVLAGQPDFSILTIACTPQLQRIVSQFQPPPTFAMHLLRIQLHIVTQSAQYFGILSCQIGRSTFDLPRYEI